MSNPRFTLSALCSLGLTAILTTTALWVEAKLTAKAQVADQESPPTLTLALHPDEPEQVTLTERFSSSNALERTEQIEAALDSFRELTAAVSSEPGAVQISEFEHTGWEIQNLGFPNWVGAVEGTVRQQDLEIKRLEWELAQKQFEDGEISAEVVAEKTAEYQQAKQAFQLFLDFFTISD